MVRSTRAGSAALLTLLVFGAPACTGFMDAPSGANRCEDCGTQEENGAEGSGEDDSTPEGQTADPPDDTPVGVGDPSTPNGVGFSTRLPKLSNLQWENTVRDLFYLEKETGLSSAFTSERLDAAYDSIAASELTVGSDAWARYQSAAEQVAVMITSDAAKLAKIKPADARAETFVKAFGRRAYRRPLSEGEVSSFASLFGQGSSLVGGEAFAAGARVVIEAMLQSPHFLYRVERNASPDAQNARKEWLSGHEVATRLSYALWNSMPSDELFDAAARGELDSREGVAKWATTMLEDSRASSVLVAFHERTYAVDTFGTQDKDPSLGFDAEALAPLLKEEARQFFRYVMNEKRAGASALLTEPVAFANEKTAPYYGLSGVTGSDLTLQKLDPQTRSGLLTQIGFLSKNATRDATDPVHRGLVIVRQVLCDEPDPPPMMFELPKPEKGLTTREVYEKATACGKGCHDTLINPPGFSFERFDTIGRTRSTDEGKPVDSTGTLTLRVGFTAKEKAENPTTELTFVDAVDMLHKLAKEPRVHECYARHFLSFVFGREPDPVERGAGELLRDVSLAEADVKKILIALVQLDAFRARVSE